MSCLRSKKENTTIGKSPVLLEWSSSALYWQGLASIILAEHRELFLLNSRNMKDKVDLVHIYIGILLGHKKRNEILPSATKWMGLESIIQSKISQSEKQIP